jgi:hypothetical protein
LFPVRLVGFLHQQTQNPPCMSAAAGFGRDHVMKDLLLSFAGLAATYSSAS